MSKDMIIGWIGLGRMGAPMVEKIIKAGYEVKIWNRTKSKACLLYTSPSPRDVEESRMPSSA